MIKSIMGNNQCKRDRIGKRNHQTKCHRKDKVWNNCIVITQRIITSHAAEKGSSRSSYPACCSLTTIKSFRQMSKNLHAIK